jgi:hypothetical protein
VDCYEILGFILAFLFQKLIGINMVIFCLRRKVKPDRIGVKFLFLLFYGEIDTNPSQMNNKNAAAESK